MGLIDRTCEKREDNMETLLLVGGIIALCGGMVFAFRSASSGVVFSFLGLTAMNSSGYTAISPRILLFWAIAVLIVLFIGRARGNAPTVASLGRNYIVGGALAGMMAGVTLGHAAMVAGSALGALLGGIAYGRTVSGKALADGHRLWRGIVEVGLPAVVSMSMAGLALEGLINRNWTV